MAIEPTYILLPATGDKPTKSKNSFVYQMLNFLDIQANASIHKNVDVASVKPQLLPFDQIATHIPHTLIKVLHSNERTGLKLIQSNASIADIQAELPGFRVLSNSICRLARVRPDSFIQSASLRPKVGITLKITDSNGKALRNVDVFAFTNYRNKTGDRKLTNSKGIVRLDIDNGKLQRLELYPLERCWPVVIRNTKIRNNDTISLPLIGDNYTDCLRHFFPTADAAMFPKVPASSRLKIAIVDSGIADHPDLNVHGGMNLLPGADASKFSDTLGHGTHVAGIIGGKGKYKGILPGVKLMAYKVFPDGSDRSQSYSVSTAIDQAVKDGCQLVNLSLVCEDMNEAIMVSIRKAYEKGVICVAAAGNGYRQDVSFPASYSLCLAVSALGRKGSFPNAVMQREYAKKPFGRDTKDFLAAFSNQGSKINVMAPGVGIISTVPRGQYGVMDGTSMACPVVTGMIGRHLLNTPNILQLPGNEARSTKILALISTGYKSLGFTAIYEGLGLLR